MTSVNQHSSPVDAVKAFIACIRTKDVEHMHKITHPKATACLIRENEPRFSALSEAIDALEKAEQDFVEVTSDEVEHIDGHYATVWANFTMHRDGEATSSDRFELILVLEKPSFGLDHPDHVRYCKITRAVRFMNPVSRFLLSRDRKYKPARVCIVSILHCAAPNNEQNIVSDAMNFDMSATVSVIQVFSIQKTKPSTSPRERKSAQAALSDPGNIAHLAAPSRIAKLR